MTWPTQLVWMCLYACLFLLVAPLMARGQDLEPSRGIWCDTQAQAERVVKLGTELGGAMPGIHAVNEESGTHACIYGIVIGIRGTIHTTVESPDGLLDVVEWTILAVHTPRGMMQLAAPLTWYTLEGSKKQGV